MKTASGFLPPSADTPRPATSSLPGGATYTGALWDHADNADSPVATASRLSPAKPRPVAYGPVLRTETMWSGYGHPLAVKRRALAALIARRNAGDRSHHLLSRIYSARTEIIAMEIASA